MLVFLAVSQYMAQTFQYAFRNLDPRGGECSAVL